VVIIVIILVALAHDYLNRQLFAICVTTEVALFAFSIISRWPIVKVATALFSSNRYINIIEVDGEYVYYGVNDLDNKRRYKLVRKSCKVCSGLFSVSVVTRKRFPSDISLLIPHSAISFEQLKQLIEQA
jgi:hypothetical protein